MNMNRTELNKMLAYEKEVYKEKVIYSKSFFLARLKNEMPYRIWKWQRLSRLTDFYKGGRHRTPLWVYLTSSYTCITLGENIK